MCKKGTARLGWELDTLPACTECNAILSALVFNTLQERKDHLQRRLKQRYAKELAHVLWSQCELDALGDSLRGYSLRMNARHEWIKQRLAVLANAVYVALPIIAPPTLADTLTIREREKVLPVPMRLTPKVKPVFKSTFRRSFSLMPSDTAKPSYGLRERVSVSDPKRWVQDANGQWDFKAYR